MGEIVEQLSLWDEIMEHYEIKQPLILCEFFSGIGAQRKGIELCGYKIDEEKSFTCEWAVPSIIGYNAIHFQDKTDYAKDLTKEQIIERINGVSSDYNQPIKLDQLNKKPIEWLRNVYNNIVATKDLINVMNVKGKDLGELPTSQTSILTYSFPCQDISNAGKGKGLDVSQAQGGTRSGLLWEIERILIERERERLNLPTILLLENVPDLLSKNHIHNFKKWEERLRQFGYTNYVDVLNACNYGIPQNRKRVFMISILGEYAYNFPRKMPLEYMLKDLLETKVDEKYYLDNKTIERIMSWKSFENPIENALDVEHDKERIMPTLTARGAGEEHSGMKLIKESSNDYLTKKINECRDEKGELPEIFNHYNSTEIGENVGVVVKDNIDDKPIVKNNLRIRKLTTNECLRLQGFSDTDYEHLVEFGLSSSQIYHCAGDSICVPCIISLVSAIGGNTSKHIGITKNYIETEIIENKLK